MKRMITFALTLCLMLSLAACGQKDSGKQETADKDQTTVEEQANQPAENEADAAQDSEADAQQDTQTINGVVNRLDDYLVLLDENGDYHTFDYGVDVDPSKLEEGDKVMVTYNGTLDGDESPVAVSIDKVVS
nr:hypothetical protein [uncultured Oscillibacter sp.]